MLFICPSCQLVACPGVRRNEYRPALFQIPSDHRESVWPSPTQVNTPLLSHAGFVNLVPFQKLPVVLSAVFGLGSTSAQEPGPSGAAEKKS